ncbi:MAG: hypothetical protein ACPHRO_10010, partial [Nannocystaceae bacterium]
MISFHSLVFTAALTAAPPDDCAGPLTREAVISCAARMSPRIEADRAHVAAAKGEADAARVILPANPTVSVTIGQRWNTLDDRALNVAGTL